MVYVAILALVCMAAVGAALVGIVGYLLYRLGRHLVHSAAVLLRLGRQKPESVAEPRRPVADT